MILLVSELRLTPNVNNRRGL